MVAQPAYSVLGSIEYEVIQHLQLVNHGPGAPAKQNLWVALISSAYPYQEVHSIAAAPDSFQLLTDEYGNRYAEFDLSDQPAGTSIVVEIRYLLSVNSLTYDLMKCSGPLPDEWTGPELHVESDNPQIKALASELSTGQESRCLQVRAFYDYVGDNLIYAFNGQDWGAQAALGPMGADCSEFASLMMALSRAAGLPARYLEGLAYLTEEDSGLGRTEHAWLELYLPGVGWAPVDPTFGRFKGRRDAYFAHLPADHIIVTRGRHPSTLRGASYYTHLYWPGDSARITIEDASWQITPLNPSAGAGSHASIPTR